MVTIESWQIPHGIGFHIESRFAELLTVEAFSPFDEGLMIDDGRPSGKPSAEEKEEVTTLMEDTFAATATAPPTKTVRRRKVASLMEALESVILDRSPGRITEEMTEKHIKAGMRISGDRISELLKPMTDNEGLIEAIQEKLRAKP